MAFYKTDGKRVPAAEFLERADIPDSVVQMLLAILVAVRDAPPPRFPASHMWHVMHGDMKGFHEARDEQNGMLYRLFCVVDRKATEHNLDAPVVAVICGGAKAVNTKMDEAVYEQARRLRDDYLATRRILLPVGAPLVGDQLQKAN